MDNLVTAIFNLSISIIGAGRASELLYTGRAMDGTEAERWGFYNRLCEPDAMLADAQAMAQALAAGPTFANAMTKKCIHQEWKMGIDESIEAEAQARRSACRPPTTNVPMRPSWPSRSRYSRGIEATLLQIKSGHIEVRRRE